MYTGDIQAQANAFMLKVCAYLETGNMSPSTVTSNDFVDVL